MALKRSKTIFFIATGIFFSFSFLFFFAFDAHAQALPSPWQHADIGSPSPAGSASFSSGVFTITADGADIWGLSDNFHFVYQSVNGDGEIIARVDSLQNTNGWAKAGVMIRETLNANSTHAMMIVTPSNGTSFQRRTTTGGSSVATTPADRVVAPYWVRLVRSGTTFTGYKSSNGTIWVQVGSATISMSSSVYVGLPVTSHSAGVLTTSNISNVSTTFSPPFDFSLSNGGNISVTQGQSVTNTITATLLSGTTQSVIFSASGLPAGATVSFSPPSCNPTCAPATMTINTISSTPTGNPIITVTGTAGALTHTTQFTLTVSLASTLSGLNCSVNDTTVNVGDPVTLSASAQNGQEPYVFSWSGPEIASARQTIYNDTFESGFGNWINVGGDNLDWTRSNIPTPTLATGPDADHTIGSGFYVYTEATLQNQNDAAFIEGPLIDFSRYQNEQIIFWYHMYGANMGTLALEAGSGGVWSTVWGPTTGNQNQWLQATVNLNTLTGQQRLRFKGLIGLSFTSDMALDDISITADAIALVALNQKNSFPASIVNAVKRLFR